MTAKHLTSQECSDARSQAQRIQKTVNIAVGRRLARCTAPLTIRPRDLPNADQDARYGLELRIEPLEFVTDFRDEPDSKIAARLREWAALLNRAAASLEG
jgi:hypothetical protein